MEIRVLGPLDLVAEDGSETVLAERHRRLLAALVIRAGQTCSADSLIEDVWGGSPPASGRKVLQVYVSRLRKKLRDEIDIQTDGSGYRLEFDHRSLDAARFERLLAEARTSLADGNAALADSVLGRALSLWRGDAYGELAYEDFARAEADRLEDLRLLAVEERLEAQLRLGRHATILSELHSLAAAHPLRERLRAQLMLALYRDGRQTEALDAFTTARARLLEEFGLEPGDELHEMQRRILQHDAALAPPDPLESPPSALPLPPNRLLGREGELAALRDLLGREDTRLVVLTGAGGSGKTRLALEVAREAAPLFANGAAFADLAPLRDAGLVVAALARAVGVESVSGRASLESLAADLRPLELLLVVDNAEHLRAAAPLYVELLAGAPRLKLLVTSRVVLHVSGEQVYPVEPLRDEAAVALFAERARQADPRFSPEHADGATIRTICARLDGLPLAIELAASRIRTLSPSELLDRLELRLPLLAGGPHDLPARQQTLRATLEWSVELLDEQEQRDLMRLAVFAGGCTLQAAATVCDATVERLASLVDQNLLRRTLGAEGSRYTMLETVREFALELLEQSPEVEDVHRRHAEFFLAVAKGANLNPGGLASGGQRLDIAIGEQENVRAALTWALTRGLASLGLELAVAMDQFWTTDDPGEGMRWFEALLDLSAAKAVATELRAHALRSYGSCAYIAGDNRTAERLWQESLALFVELGDEHGRSVLLHRLGNVALQRGELERARALVEQSHGIHKQNEDQWKKGWAVAQTTGTLGAIARDAGDPELAFELIGESAALARRSLVPWWESGMLAELAALSLGAGRVDEAEVHALESLALAKQMRDYSGRVFGVGLFAWIAAERNEHERAGRLWGAIEDADAVAPLGGWRRHRQACATRMRDVAGPAFERGRMSGRALMLDDAVSFALEPVNS